MEFVTSMSMEGYELYGREFLERAMECLPGPLAVYTENDKLFEVKGVDWRSLNEVEGYHWFLDGIDRFQKLAAIQLIALHRHRCHELHYSPSSITTS